MIFNHFIFGKWHAWAVMVGKREGVMLSNEETKTLKTFFYRDELVNYLYLSGDKEAARAFNKHIKEEA